MVHLRKQQHNNHTRKRTQFPCQFAVHSYTSAAVCRSSILRLLSHYRVPSTHITVFVQDDSHKDTYTRVLRPGTYHSIVVATGDIGLFVHEYYPVGTAVCNVLDSVTGFVQYNQPKLTSLLDILTTAFQDCVRHNATLWGLYPYPIPSQLQPTITTQLQPISRCMWGCISLGSRWIPLTNPVYADYERCILHYQRDGKVLRLNYVAAVCQSKPSRTSAAAKALVSMYPDYVSYKQYANGTYRICLRSPTTQKDTL